MNFQEAIAARGLKEPARYRKPKLTASRTEYYWPGTRTLDPYTRRYGNADEISRKIAVLRSCVEVNAVQSYVAIWCQLNHLKEC